MRGKTKVSSISALIACVVMLGTVDVHAALLGLKQVQVSGGSQVDLLFDGKISKKQIQTEFFKDIIQISLSDTSVYPAKISTVNGSDLTKIFAYQYTPKLVRCRLSIKGKAEDYKDRVEIVPNGKVLSVRIRPEAVDSVALSAAKPVEAPKAPKANAEDPEQKKLLEKVMREDPAAAKPEARADSKPENKGETKAETKALGGGKPLPSPFRVFGKLAAILGLIAGVAFVFKKVLRNNPVLSRLTKNGLGKKRMIEVLSNHHLGPKKSIAVVRVAGRTMVLGVTDESINLITQLGGDSIESGMNMEISELEELGLKINEPARKLGDAQQARREARQAQAESASLLSSPAPRVDFSELLKSETRKPALGAPINNSPLGVRARIRSRLEGLKQL